MAIDEIENFVRRGNTPVDIDNAKIQIDLNRCRVQPPDRNGGRRFLQDRLLLSRTVFMTSTTMAGILVGAILTVRESP